MIDPTPISDAPDKCYALAPMDAVRLLVQRPHNNRYERTDLKPLITAHTTGFTLPNLLSAPESAKIQALANKVGWQSLEKLFPHDYRSNDRILLRSPELAQALFDRILPSLRPEELQFNAMGPTGSGIWLPYRLNEMIKAARYRPGCLFKAHRDGPWTPSIDQISQFTVVIYLNSQKNNFRGGETNFLAEDDPRKVIASVTPVTGTALVFSHALKHEGAGIIGDNEKFIIRTELIFRRVKSVLDPSPAFLAASEDLRKIVKAYEESDKAVGKDKERFLREYLDAIELQSESPPEKASQMPFLPADIMRIIMARLSLWEILNKLGSLNKSCYRISRDNAFWRSRFQRDYPDLLPPGLQHLDTDWALLYRHATLEKRAKASQPSMVIGCASAEIQIYDKGAQPPPRQIAFCQIDRTYMHSSHSGGADNRILKWMTYDQLKSKIENDIAITEADCLTDEDGHFTSEGAQTLVRVSSYDQHVRHSNRGFPRRLLCVVPDVWNRAQLPHVPRSSIAANLDAAPRFMQFSVGAAKYYHLTSAVVLHVGYRSHFISLVLNKEVIRHQRLLNVQPAMASRVAWLVHDVLSTVQALVPSAAHDAEHAAACLARLAATDSAAAQGVATRLKSAQEKHATVNPNDPRVLRELLGHNVVITGGHVRNAKRWADYADRVSVLLKSLDPKWNVHSDREIAGEEAARAAMQANMYGADTFGVFTALPITPLPPCDVPSLLDRYPDPNPVVAEPALPILAPASLTGSQPSGKQPALPIRRK